jgi:hypothetical protein
MAMNKLHLMVTRAATRVDTFEGTIASGFEMLRGRELCGDSLATRSILLLLLAGDGREPCCRRLRRH